jgi:hypothetical protein
MSGKSILGWFGIGAAAAAAGVAYSKYEEQQKLAKAKNVAVTKPAGTTVAQAAAGVPVTNVPNVKPSKTTDDNPVPDEGLVEPDFFAPKPAVLPTAK